MAPQVCIKALQPAVKRVDCLAHDSTASVQCSYEFPWQAAAEEADLAAVGCVCHEATAAASKRSHAALCEGMACRALTVFIHSAISRKLSYVHMHDAPTRLIQQSQEALLISPPLQVLHNSPLPDYPCIHSTCCFRSASDIRLCSSNCAVHSAW
jgi:hypothetical protein